MLTVLLRQSVLILSASLYIVKDYFIFIYTNMSNVQHVIYTSKYYKMYSSPHACILT